MVDFGVRLRALRVARRITQKELAEQLGLTKSVVSAYETGMRYPSYDILVKISSLFHVSTDYLLGNAPQPGLSVEGLSERDCELVRMLIARLRGDESREAVEKSR